MTKKEFKMAMLRGLGRCVTAVREDPERYRDMVLWACTRNIAYDTQCEGARSWYVYTLVKEYADQAPFVRAAEEAMKNYRSDGGWDLLHVSELLMFFAKDGYTSAKEAVEKKYQEFLSLLFARRFRPDRVFHECWNLEQLGIVLAIGRDSALKIAKDFGRLYREKSYLTHGEFPWFFSRVSQKYGKSIDRAAQKDADIALFLQREGRAEEEQQKPLPTEKENLPETVTGVRLSRWLARNGDPDTVRSYALAYREETDPALRAEALTAFSCCPYPDDPEPIIQDAQSSHKELQNVAWRALEKISHPAVRDFAVENISTGNRLLESFALLMSNYTPEDEKVAKNLLLQWIHQKDWDSIHGAGLDVFRAFDTCKARPKHLLPLLYEYNPCSCCRETTLRYMAKHRMLSKDLLEECIYDSDGNIRYFARGKLK